KHAARIAFPQLRGAPECSQRNPAHAVRVEMARQRTGDFTLELLKHRGKVAGLLLLSPGGYLSQCLASLLCCHLLFSLVFESCQPEINVLALFVLRGV